MPNLFGIPDSSLNELGDQSMAGTLTKFGNETIERLRASLRAKTSQGTTKNLEQSIIVLPIEYKGQLWKLEFQAEDYWKFINSGVSGVGGFNESKQTPFVNKAPESPFSFKTKKPPLVQGTGLSLWSYTKGLNEYAVREGVFREGIKATHYQDEVIDEEWIQELVKRLEKAGAKEIAISLKKKNAQ